MHQANGGILIISLRTLLAQPLLWMRLKNIVNRERFDWVAFDESRPLPVSVPSMPLKLKVILVGERESLADFQEMDPELSAKQHATLVNKKHFRLARSGSSASVKRSPPCAMATPSPASS